MTRIRAAAAVVVAAAAVAAVPAAAAVPKLAGTVGPGPTLGLKLAGKNVTTVKAGKYSLTVADRSPIHNFRLKGLGVNVATTVGGVGTKTFAITLRRGVYTIVCDPHKSSMKRTLTVR